MKFPREKFNEFCEELLVDTKERGQIYLTQKNQLGTQKYFVQRVTEGLAKGIHSFAVLKGRGEGITTICAALDLFWHYWHPGMQGTFASHDEEARDNFRAMLTMYHDGLPKPHRQRRVSNNRHFIAFQNRSKISMQIGGGSSGRSKGKGKGRGQHFTFTHATECSSWEDQNALHSFRASLAQSNPNRLHIWESTARGYELFHDIWKTAKRSVTQDAIFIGWWLNELYRKEKGSNEYEAYWTGDFTPAEARWVRDIKTLYGYDIQPEQIAWWRFMLAEEITDEKMLMQEFPATENHAFVLSGNNFFNLSTVDRIEKEIEVEPPPRYYLFKFGDSFVETEVEETIEQINHLSIWEMPDPIGHYSIGADPAVGESDWQDGFAIEVFRCYADRFDQVAEFCTSQMTVYRFAWVLCCLAGLYRNSRVNLEINGPGEAVQNEINNLRRQAVQIPSRGDAMSEEQYKSVCDNRTIMRDALGMMKYYLYRRLDSPYGGMGAYHTLSTQKMKYRMMNGFNDLIEKKEAVLRSQELMEEMKIVVREDGILGAPGKKKDDRVIASALSAVQYIEHMKMPLSQMGVTFERELARRAQAEAKPGSAPITMNETALAKSVRGYLNRVGIKG